MTENLYLLDQKVMLFSYKNRKKNRHQFFFPAFEAYKSQSLAINSARPQRQTDEWLSSGSLASGWSPGESQSLLAANRWLKSLRTLGTRLYKSEKFHFRLGTIARKIGHFYMPQEKLLTNFFPDFHTRRT